MTSTRAMREVATPWYKQFWPWFLIALPGSVVIAAFITLFIAIRHADEIVQDDYYKDGLAINQKIERDEVARKLQLSARIRWQTENGVVFVELPASITDKTLTLHWMHPLQRRFDQNITLTRQPTTGIYVGRRDATASGRFYLELENTTPDVSLAWRLRGEIRIDATANQASVTLAP